MIKQLAHAVAYLHDSGEWNLMFCCLTGTFDRGCVTLHYFCGTRTSARNYISCLGGHVSFQNN